MREGKIEGKRDRGVRERRREFRGEAITRRERSPSGDLFRPLRGTVAGVEPGEHENYSRLDETRPASVNTRCLHVFMRPPGRANVETERVLNNLWKEKRGCVP